MINFPSRPARRTSPQKLLTPIVFVLALLSPQGPALQAQSTSGQDDNESSFGAPLSLTPLAPKADDLSGQNVPSQNQGQEQVPQVQGIEINPLSERDPESVGILAVRDGGLGQDLWAGSSNDAIKGLLAKLPGDIASPVLRDLAVRLLLTIAAAPNAPAQQAASGQASLQILASDQSEDPSSGGLSQDESLMSLRVGRLAALGDLDALGDLLAAAPERSDNNTIAETRVNLSLTVGDFDGGCRRVRRNIGQFGGELFWSKALIFCQFLSGEVDQANLGLDLLRELGPGEDSAFMQLAQQMAGGAEQAIDFTGMTPLQFAMLRALERELPPEGVENAAPMLLSSIARWPVASLETRTIAAEQAVARNLLNPEELAQLYAGWKFDEAQVANPVSSVEELPPLEGRALMVQAASAQTIDVSRAELLQAAFELDLDLETYRVMLRVLAPSLNALPARRDLLWFAETAGRAHFALGQPDKAAAWVRLAQREAVRSQDAAVTAAALWPYVRLAGEGPLAGPGDLGTWASAAAANRSPQALTAQVSLLLAAFRSLGEVDPLTWADLAQGDGGHSENMSEPALFYLLQEAGGAGKRGESVLATLALFGDRNPSPQQLVVVGQALTALSQVGLTPEARALAIEAAIAGGI